MYWFSNLHSFFVSLFELLTFRIKPTTDIELNDIENHNDYEFIILNNANQMNR